MGFQQGLSGLNTSSKALDVVGNNVSNSGTIGFKSARAQFADVFAASLGGAGGASQVGIGARIATVAQQFSQGNITATSNALDVAINGNGMYVMKDAAGATSYTRSGQFQLDKNGYLVGSDGLMVQGYPADYSTNSLGVINATSPKSIYIDPKDLQPQATSKSGIAVNLDARKTIPTAGHERFSLTDPLSYNDSTSISVFDSLGNVHTLSMYFIYAGTATDTKLAGNPTVAQWQVRYAIDGKTNPTTNYPPVVPPATAPSPWTQSLSVPLATVGTAATQGTLVGGAYTPNAADAGGTLSIKVDGAAVAQTITIPPGTYANAAAVATAINAAGLTGATAAANAAGCVTITSALTGTTSSVSVAGGLSSAVFGTAPIATSGKAASSGTAEGGTYAANAADAGGALTVTVDGGAPQTIRIPAASYGKAQDVANAINAAGLTGARAIVNGNGGLSIVSSTTGTASTVTVAAGAFTDSVFGPPFASGDNITLCFDTSGKLVDYGTGGGAGGPATFQGTLTPPPSLTMNVSNVVGQNKAATPLTIKGIDFSSTTQFGSAFGVNDMTQDGYASGRLTKISISKDGVIQGNYTNGQTRNMAQIILARFTNPNGLQSIGNNQWQETYDSGVPLVGAPGSSSNGLLQGSALEESTVDLTKELVDMITYQRSYQANAQTIKTQDSMLQTITNLR